MRLDAATYLGAWPFRDLEGTRVGLLAAMKEVQADQALVSPLTAFFHLDPEPANTRLLKLLKGHANLWAAPVLNPRMSDATRYLAQLARIPQVRAVRLATGFQGYPAAQAEEVVRAAAQVGLAAILQLRMQDERSHAPAFRIPPVPMREALDLAARVPDARLVIAAARLGEVERGELAERVRGLPNVWLDLSHVDGVGTLRRAQAAVGLERLLFATSWPWFYAQSNALKLFEADLTDHELALVEGGNAVRAFALASGEAI